MKESFWGIMIFVFGIVAILIVYFFQSMTNTNEHNYVLLKEVTEGAMVDAIDLAHYRKTGEVRIDQEKFVENFVRRFAQSTQLSRTYVIKIYDINEEPPKVSLQVSSTESTSVTNEILDFDIVNRLDAILETPNDCPDTSIKEEVTGTVIMPPQNGGSSGGSPGSGFGSGSGLGQTVSDPDYTIIPRTFSSTYENSYGIYVKTGDTLYVTTPPASSNQTVYDCKCYKQVTVTKSCVQYACAKYTLKTKKSEQAHTEAPHHPEQVKYTRYGKMCLVNTVTNYPAPREYEASYGASYCQCMTANINNCIRYLCDIYTPSACQN